MKSVIFFFRVLREFFAFFAYGCQFFRSNER